MRSSCGGAALWLFFPLNEIFTMKICAFKCVGNILSVSWCSAWSVSALYLSESEDSMTGSFQPCGILTVPGSSGERVWKQEVKHLLFGWITWTIPEWAVRPTRLHQHPQGRWDSNSSRSSCLQIQFRRNLATESKLLNSSTLVVNEMRTVLSTSLIRAS